MLVDDKIIFSVNDKLEKISNRIDKIYEELTIITKRLDNMEWTVKSSNSRSARMREIIGKCLG